MCEWCHAGSSLYQLDEGSGVEEKSMSSHWNSQVYMLKRNRRDGGAGQLGPGSLQLHRWKEQRNSVFSSIRCFLSRLRFMSRDGQGCGGVAIIFNSRPLLWCLEFESFTSVLRELNECHCSGVPSCFLQSETLLPRAERKALMTREVKEAQRSRKLQN